MEQTEAMDTGQPPPLLPPPPPQYTLEIADAVIFCSEKDEEQAEDFVDRVKEMMKDVCPVVIHMQDDIAGQGSELKSAGEICKLAVYQWLYITENAIADPQVMLHKDEQIMRSLSSSGTFIPIWNKSKSKFSSLPYGLAAYGGLNEQDTDRRLKRQFERLFNSDHHQSLKEARKKQQEEARNRWEAVESKRHEEKLRLHKRNQEQRMARMRADVQKMMAPGGTVPESNEEMIRLFYQLQLERQSSSPGQSPPQPRRSNSPDGAMPADILHSLNSARSSMSPSTTTVYNITINQPERVQIGGASGGVQAGDQEAEAETRVKNIAADATNARLNLVEDDSTERTPCDHSDSSESYDLLTDVQSQ